MVVLLFESSIAAIRASQKSSITAKVCPGSKHQTVAGIATQRRIIFAGHKIRDLIRAAVRHAQERPSETIFKGYIPPDLPAIPKIGLDVMPADLRERVGLGLAAAPNYLVPEHVEGAVTSLIVGHTPVESILLGFVIDHLVLLVGGHQKSNFERVISAGLLEIIPENVELLECRVAHCYATAPASTGCLRSRSPVRSRPRTRGSRSGCLQIYRRWERRWGRAG